LWTDGIATNLGTLGGTSQSYVTDINDLGVAVGGSHIAGNSAIRAFVWRDGKMSELPVSSGNGSSAASAINNRGQIVGSASSVYGGPYHAFVYTDGVTVDIGTMGGPVSTANGINDLGDVVGVSALPDNTYHAFIYSHSDSTLQDLGPVPWMSSVAAINNRRQIVGSILTTSGETHAVLWESGRTIDLNDYLPPNSRWTVLTAANGINNVGQIAGQGIIDGQIRGFLMTPVDASRTAAVAAYRFDSGYAPLAVDSSEHGNHGVLSGQASTVTDFLRGDVLSLDGNSRVIVPSAPSLDLRTAFTLEAWVKPTITPSGWATVLLKESLSGLSYALYASDNAPWPAGYARVAGIDRVVKGTDALPLKEWTHLATTYDGARMRLFVNGALVGSRVQTGTVTTSGRDLQIGGNEYWGEYFAGLIDDVRIYDFAWSEDQIRLNMAVGVPRSPSTESELVVMPSVVNQTEAEAHATITAAGLTVGAVTRATSETVPEGHIVKSVPEAGRLTAIGGAVALEVSTGTIRPGCIAAPDAPRDLIATVGPGAVVLKWTPPLGLARDLPTSYVFEAGSTATTTFQTLHTGSSETSFVKSVSGVVGSVFVRVRGVNACGVGSVSNTLQIVLP
jgi:probable HAF family extracellular repeat protein